MTEKISKCGNDCSICPWSKKIQDSMSSEDYETYKTDCKNSLGFAPTGPYQNCVGCQTPEDEWPKDAKIPLKNCTTRICVLKSDLVNCAYCSRFPCAYIEKKASEWSKENVEKRMNKVISDEDFQKFVLPFEAFDKLKAIRENLAPEKIIAVNVQPPLVIPIVDFPELLNNTDLDVSSFKAIHSLLKDIAQSDLGLDDIDVYAQQEILKSRIKHLFRFLWIIGKIAYFDEAENDFILEAKPFLKNKFSETSLSKWSFLDGFVISKLREFGVIVTVIQLFDEKFGSKGYITPTGSLRDKNWKMKVSFSEVIGGADSLKALLHYLKCLEEKYGKNSFKFFNKVDLRVLLAD